MKSEALMIDYLFPISSRVKIRIQIHKNIFVDHLEFFKGQNGLKNFQNLLIMI